MLRKTVGFVILIAAGLLMQGCMEVEQDLILNQDGSGTLDVRYVLAEASLQAAGFDRPELEDVLNKSVVLSERGLREQFGGEGVDIVSSHFEWREEAVHVSFNLKFKSLAALLEKPALRGSGVGFYRTDKGNLALEVQTRQILGPSLNAKALSEILTQTFEAKARVTLPSMVLENNADSIEDTILTWRYTKEKVTPEIMTAVCEGAGLAFLAVLPAESKDKTEGKYVFSSAGKPDPFRPFILESRAQGEKEKILNPLQRYDISQLSLVAIIWQAARPTAVVQDATGKGYIITRGTPIGRNEGIVTDITEKEVVIAEKTVDLLGETKTKEVRVRLHQEEREVK